MTPAPSPSRASAPATFVSHVSSGNSEAWEDGLLTGTPMGHVAEDVSRIAHDLVVAMSFDMTDEPYTTHAAAQEESKGLRGWSISYETSQTITDQEDLQRLGSGVKALGQSGCSDCLVVGECS